MLALCIGNMNSFPNPKPNLVDVNITQNIKNIISQNVKKHTLLDKLCIYIYQIYHNYFKPNKFLIIITVSIVLFLYYRYDMKKRNDLKNRKRRKSTINEDFSDDVISLENNISPEVFKSITQDQTAHLQHNNQPHYNPAYPINTQEMYVNYPPGPISLNIDGDIKYARNSNNPRQPINQLYAPPVNFFNAYEQPSYEYYTGTENPYEKSQDTLLENPLGFPTDFNTTTGNFMCGMTEINKKNIADYKEIVEKERQQLLKPKRDFLDISDMYIEPPYSE